MAPPVVSNIAPPVDTLIAADGPVSFDVTVVAGTLALVVVTIKFPGINTQEVVYDGTSFTDPYLATSSITPIVGGYAFSIVRRNGWPDSPTLLVYAVSSTATVGTVTPASWLIASVAPPPVLEAVSVYAPGGSVEECNAIVHDAAYFIGVVERAVDTAWLDGLRSSATGGFELVRAMAAVFARASTAVSRYECGSFIIFARGGAFSAGMVEFYRADAGAGAVVVKAGTRVKNSESAREYITLDDASFGALSLGPVAVRVLATAQGWEWDARGQRTTARGETLAGSVDAIALLVQEPPFGDPTIQVRQVGDIAGGAAPMLDGLGADRGVVRGAGEADAAYAFRQRQLPDTVTPGAINRVVQGLLGQWNAPWYFVETHDVAYQTCWDAPNALIAGSAFDPNLFVWDDPRPAVPFRNRWLDSLEDRGAFIIVVPTLAAIRDTGLAFDDTAATPAALDTANGARATNAYDVPSTFAFALQGGYDGSDLRKNATYLGLWNVLQRVKAAGVAALVELQGE